MKSEWVARYGAGDGYRIRASGGPATKGSSDLRLPETGLAAQAAFLSACGVGLALFHPTLSRWAGFVLACGVVFIAWRVARRVSAAFRLYLVYVLVWFFLGPIAGLFIPAVEPNVSTSELGFVWLTVTVWVIGWTIGQMVAGDRPKARSAFGKTATVVGSAGSLVAVGVVALLVELFEAIHGASAYATQIAGGVNTGIAGTVGSLAAPALSAGVVLKWPSASLRTRVMLGLALLLQAGVSTLSGFRGPAMEFLIGVGIAYLIVNPLVGSGRRRTIIATVLILVAVGIPLTLFAGAQRSAQAQAHGYSGGALSLSSLPKTVVTRFDEVPALSAGLHASGAEVRRVASISSQLGIFVPRVLWPKKPIFNYGEQISTAVYGIPASYHTASTITWLGDLYFNGGLPLVLVAAVLLGVAARRSWQRAVRGSAMEVLVAVLILQVLLTAESPLTISIAGALRSFLLIAGMWYAVRQLTSVVRNSP